MKFKYKPNEVEAIQYTGNREEILKFTNGDTLTNRFPGCYIINKGDWIVKEDNKFYLYTTILFNKYFESV